MVFEVWAGRIYCGYLEVRFNWGFPYHIYRNYQGERELPCKLLTYKSLQLIRRL